MPTAGGLDKALRRGAEIGCTAVQVFTSNPRMWKAPALTEDTIAAFDLARKETRIQAIASHDTYLVNLCATSDEIREKSIASLIAELGRCAQLAIPWVVSHIGAHMGQGEVAGMRLAAENMVQVLEATPASVMLLMETTAGQGTTLNWRFEHLAQLLEFVEGNARVGVCLDTCHVFAAGYDIRTPEGYEATFTEFSRTVGIERLKVIHCNDSKMPLGSKRDRHEHLGEGEIGPAAFQLLVKDSRFESVPIIVETPDAETEHQRNVASLWNWSRS